MGPVIRRSAFFYLTHLGTFSLFLPWPYLEGAAFEVVPLFMPIWLSSSVLFSERDESYAFLRAMPVTDRAIVRAKFGILLSASAAYWLVLTGLALAVPAGLDPGWPAGLLVTLTWGFSLLLAAVWQIGIWRFGQALMTWFISGYMALNMIAAIPYSYTLRRGGWEGVRDAAVVHQLAERPWISLPLAGVVVLTAFWGLMQAGVRVKQSSEACL